MIVPLEVDNLRSVMKRLLAVMAVALPSLAQAEILTAVPETATGSELQATRRAIEYSALRQEKLANEAAALAREQQELSRQLIETAAQIRARETMRLESQERIDRLSRDEAALRNKLTERSDELAGLLGGLLRLERNPPPALLASPQDALKASRAAMLFGALVPALRFETAALSRDLARLIHLRSSIAAENRSLAANLEKLRFARLQLEGFFDRRKALLAAAGEALSKERKRAHDLARKARNLEQLVKALAAEKRKRDSAENQADVSAKPSPATQKPPPAFSQSLGRLDYPARGRLIRRFGDADGFGGHSKGIFLVTRPDAQVISPVPGRVAFAGNFRSYGQLLILDVGEGYHVLLAGMARVDVETGQSVAAGEPVGEMGETPAQGTVIGDQLSDQRPIIYIEFRKAGSAVDPSGWWIGGNKEARN
jgi:septal ring factor EnvC (AmiA/AmiB activator)